MTSSHQRLLLILLLVVVSIFLNFPPQFVLGGKTITRPNLNLKLGPLNLSNNIKFKLGLDLAGGSQITLAADMSSIGATDRGQALVSLKEIIGRRVDLFGVAEPSIRTEQQGDQDRIIIELPGLTDPAAALTLIGSTAQLEFKKPITLAPPDATPGAEPLLTFVTTDLTGKDLKKTSVVFDPQTGKPTVSLEFNADGTKKFAQLTKELLNKPLAIFLDNQLITAPVVQSEIVTGQAVITGSFTKEEAKTLSTQLNAGALPVPVSVISQQNVAPTLGIDSITKSVRAGLIGLAIVIAFIVLIYRQMGILSSIGLLIYGLLSLSLYKLAGITLTLPGIAGFILSIGMAVDSNILIFERYKEEIKNGRSWPVALELAFGRALNSIKDANITTIITALILFNPLGWSFLPTSGPIRGFALTLLLGVLMSLFTGIFVTRTLLRLFFRGKDINKDGSKKK